MKKLRNTNYAREIASASTPVNNGDGMIERIFIKGDNEEAYRFSWWKDSRMIPRPLDITEVQLLKLMEKAILENVFTDNFLNKLTMLLERK